MSFPQMAFGFMRSRKILRGDGAIAFGGMGLSADGRIALLLEGDAAIEFGSMGLSADGRIALLLEGDGGIDFGGMGISGDYSLPLWTPSTITTQVWLDATDSSTITLTSGSVSQWSDKSGNARHFTQTNAAQHPSQNATGINGLNCLNFDDTNDGLLSSFNMVRPFSVYFVASQRRIADIRAVNSNSVNALISATRPANNVFINGDIRSAAFASINEVFMAELLCTPSTNNFYKNGALLNTNTSPLGAWGVVGLGSTPTNSESLSGLLAEVIITNESISRLEIEGYLAHKWGLTASLPSDHPYKNSPPTV